MSDKTTVLFDSTSNTVGNISAYLSQFDPRSHVEIVATFDPDGNLETLKLDILPVSSLSGTFTLPTRSETI